MNRQEYLNQFPSYERSEAAARWDHEHENPLSVTDPATRERFRSLLLKSAREIAIIHAHEEGRIGYRLDQILSHCGDDGMPTGAVAMSSHAMEQIREAVSDVNDPTDAEIIDAISQENADRARYIHARYGITPINFLNEADHA